jgi:trans-aconitate methyltransferase
VLGTDLSKIQPESHPPNCDFIKEDAEEDWVYPNIPGFDYIHLRAVFTAFDDPKKVLRHAWDSLNPGGWIEYQDMYPVVMSHDGSHEGTSMELYWNLMRQALTARGRDPMVATKYKGWFQEFGCTLAAFSLFYYHNSTS